MFSSKDQGTSAPPRKRSSAVSEEGTRSPPLARSLSRALSSGAQSSSLSCTTLQGWRLVSQGPWVSPPGNDSSCSLSEGAPQIYTQSAWRNKSSRIRSETAHKRSQRPPLYGAIASNCQAKQIVKVAKREKSLPRSQEPGTFLSICKKVQKSGRYQLHRDV